MDTRTERDSMGTMHVPESALYGASTQRAVLNFPVSGHPMPARFISAVGLVKFACARAAGELGLVPQEKSDAICAVALEIAEGKWLEHFPIDVFQTGSATSTNTNANEVIARRAGQLSGTGATPLHPNDDVNFGQSSNDTMPTALHVSVALALRDDLQPALVGLAEALECKASDWQDIVKIGRTHLMDATPLRLGQEFSGYSAQARKAVKRISQAENCLQELALGGTAVGTGLNCPEGLAARAIELLHERTGIAFRPADNHFEAQAARDDCVEVAGYLATVAASMTKIANDIRWLGSGPRAGLSELRLAPTQPGSSIMPGKVNPVMCEMLLQTSMYVSGLCHCAQLCGREGGQFELNTTIPLFAHVLHEAIRCLSHAVRIFTKRCVVMLEPDRDRCAELVARSLMLVTALNPHIGYDRAAQVAKKAFAEGKTLREVILELGWMDSSTLDAALDPSGMTGF